MAKPKRQLSLSVFVGRHGTHPHASKRPGVKVGGTPDFQEYAKIVQQLERGKFDFAFFADFVGNGGAEVRGGAGPRGGGFEPLTLVSALATVTQKIGLVATVNTNFNEPYNLARRLASIDHLSGGRVGWNVVSSLSDGAAKTFGIGDDVPRDSRYERASEFIDVAKQLWDTWDDGAFDPRPDGSFAPAPEVGRGTHFHGQHFDVDAVLDIARPLQGYPVFFQAGNSDVGREFAAKYAEVIYAAAQTTEEAQAYYRDVKGRMAKYGREPEHLIVTPGLFYHLGQSRQEAQEKYESFRDAVDLRNWRDRFTGFFDIAPEHLVHLSLDDKLPADLPEPKNNVGRFRQARALALRENLSIRDLILRFQVVQGHRILVGTATDIADQIEDWFLNGAADGFNLKPSFVPESLQDFIDQVVPQLQRRGIFRTEYTGKTLRENLGLPRPANPRTVKRVAAPAVAVPA